MIPTKDPISQRTVQSATYNGIWEQINMNLDGSNTEYCINQLNGRQGDKNRELYIQAMKTSQDGLVPYEFGTLHPRIQGKNADGQPLEFGENYQVVDPQGGTIIISVPAEAYTAVGVSQNMVFEFTDDQDTVVSSVPIVYETVQNGALLTPTESKAYMQSVQDIIDKVQGQITPLQLALELYKQSTDNADNDLKALIAAIATKNPAILTNDQTFTGHNVFNGLTTAQNVDTLGTLHVGGFDVQQLIDFYKTFSDTGWTHDATAWLNGAYAWKGTNGFWMRKITFMGVHLIFISLACWLPDGSNGNIPIVAMPLDWVGDVTNNNYFAVPIWGVTNGSSAAFGASINASAQLVITANGGKNIGVNSTMLYVN